MLFDESLVYCELSDSGSFQHVKALLPLHTLRVTPLILGGDLVLLAMDPVAAVGTSSSGRTDVTGTGITVDMTERRNVYSGLARASGGFVWRLCPLGTAQKMRPVPELKDTSNMQMTVRDVVAHGNLLVTVENTYS